MKEGGSATAPNAAVAPTVEIHPFPSRDGLLVKILPPQQPSNPNLDHVPVDIVLCIDVSGSMNDDAKVPGEKESNGLCILDLAKHAARTILETLNQNDRLGIVTFTNWAKVCSFKRTLSIAVIQTLTAPFRDHMFKPR